MMYVLKLITKLWSEAAEWVNPLKKVFNNAGLYILFISVLLLLLMFSFLLLLGILFNFISLILFASLPPEMF